LYLEKDPIPARGHSRIKEGNDKTKKKKKKKKKKNRESEE